jgi:Sulfatase
LTVSPKSVLLITLDSCRYDTFVVADAQNMKAVGPLHRAMAPANFTLGSHVSIFSGFTPGVIDAAKPYVNPKFGRIFKLGGPAFAGLHPPFIALEGRNIIEGFARNGFATIGTGAVAWFNPKIETGKILTESFQQFFYFGAAWCVDEQVAWAKDRVANLGDQPVFLFLNLGETHVPYFFKSASWDPRYNPCVPFGSNNDRFECRRRQIACVEYVDRALAELLTLFAGATTIICADHGDCWGEDGVWEHGISHPKVLEVPLLFHLGAR